MSEQHSEAFRSQVQRLVAEGKLTAEEAAELLDVGEGGSGVPTEVQPESPHESRGVAHFVRTVTDPDPAGSERDHAEPSGPEWPEAEGHGADLHLKVDGYHLSVVRDDQAPAPTLSASQDGELTLTAQAHGWRVERVPGQRPHWTSPLRAVLTVPFTPGQVQAEVNGGQLTLPDLAGELLAQVSGGQLSAGQAAGLQAEVNGGHLTAGGIAGPTHLSVNGGHLTLDDARSLNASVNGGHLKWNGLLSSGDHRLEVNAGNATLGLRPGSSVRVEASVTVGQFRADFATDRQGGLLNTRHHGQLGTGAARLSCQVAAGQVKVVTL